MVEMPLAKSDKRQIVNKINVVVRYSWTSFLLYFAVIMSKI